MSLEKLRKKIDAIDSKIVELLNARAHEVKEVNAIKKSSAINTFSAEREEQVLRRVRQLNTKANALSPDDVAQVFSEIMSVCRGLQAHLKIAYFGPAGTFTHMAAIKKFGKKPEYLPFDTIGDVFDAVERNHVDYGVVPVENSTDGVVSSTLDMFFTSQLQVCSQVTISVSQCLMGKGAVENIKKVYSKQIVFGQCRKWLSANLGFAQLEDCISTARAAQIVSQEKNSACIGNKILAEMYGLKVLQGAIEDSPYNYTRFLVIGKNDSLPSGKDKTSLLLAIKDKVGALHDVLNAFKKDKINLTKIESRPSKEKPWEYRFFIDFEGHRQDPHIQKVLNALEKECTFVKILGSYPA